MAQKLRALADGEKPPAAPPKTLLEATDGSRMDFLRLARRHIAIQIDTGGVPAHALGRLIGEMDRLDTEIRKLEDMGEEPPIAVEDGKFDADAV